MYLYLYRCIYFGYGVAMRANLTHTPTHLDKGCMWGASLGTSWSVSSPFVDTDRGEGLLSVSIPLCSTSPLLFILHHRSVCRMLCMLYYLKCQLLLGLTLLTENLLYSVQHNHPLIKRSLRMKRIPMATKEKKS